MTGFWILALENSRFVPQNNSLFGKLRTHGVIYHGVVATLFYLGFFLLFALFVRWYTQHGQTIAVPEVAGKSFSEAVQILENVSLHYRISDSVYDESKPPLTVIDQTPLPASLVKDGRTVYLTINATTPPRITMPDLKDVSLKQASMILQSYGLKVGKLTYKPDLAKDVVLETRVGGKAVNAGAEIKKGDKVDLILGDGLGETSVEVPNLIGLTLREAKFVLDGSSLSLGALVLDASVKRDTLDAVVYRQMPPPNDPDQLMMNMGEGVDLFLTSPQDYNLKTDDLE